MSCVFGVERGKKIHIIPQVFNVFVQKRSQLLGQRRRLVFSLASRCESAKRQYSIFEGHVLITPSRMPEPPTVFTTRAHVIEETKTPMDELPTPNVVRTVKGRQNFYLTSRKFDVFVQKRSQLTHE